MEGVGGTVGGWIVVLVAKAVFLFILISDEAKDEATELEADRYHEKRQKIYCIDHISVLPSILLVLLIEVKEL